MMHSARSSAQLARSRLSTTTATDLRAAVLDRLALHSPTLHRYVADIFRYQQAQLEFTKLRDRHERDEVVRRMMQPALQQMQAAEHRLADFVKTQPVHRVGTTEHKQWQDALQQLQKSLDDARRQCDVAQDSSVAATIQSLKDLDAHSDTYRLFATSAHYGYLALVALCWVLYKLYCVALWTVDRLPASRKDIKLSRAATDKEIQGLHRKLDEVTYHLSTRVAAQQPLDLEQYSYDRSGGGAAATSALTSATTARPATSDQAVQADVSDPPQAADESWRHGGSGGDRFAVVRWRQWLEQHCSTPGAALAVATANAAWLMHALALMLQMLVLSRVLALSAAQRRSPAS